MELGLKGKKVMLTGGSRGIGRATLELFCEEECDVAFFSRNQEQVYSKQSSQAWGPKRIRVNAVTPGPVSFPTANWEVIKTAAPDCYNATGASFALSRFGASENTARSTVFLAGPASSDTTGSKCGHRRRLHEARAGLAGVSKQAHCNYLLLFTLIALAVFPGYSNAATFHSVYYHRLQGSFWAQLADDTGASPTPRELAIASVDDNFKAIRALGFDTVTVGLPDSDGWVSQHGGGFSYDPNNPAAGRPQFAVAQEIVVRLAAAEHLNVVFAISFSEYRRSSDGRAAWAGLADEYGSSTTPKGAYDYLHALIDPTAYYGTLTTTKLAVVGVTDGPIHSYVGDPRIAGWNLAGEWNPNVVNPTSKIRTHERTFKKYWNFFYDLVHFHGANNAFASTYLIGQPGGGDAQVANIKAFKQWFAPGTGIKPPDLIGVEYYGNGNYDLTAIAKDLNKMLDAMETADPARYPHDFTIAHDKVFLGEGGTNQVSNPAVSQYFKDVFRVQSERKLAGLQLWVSDTLGDAKDAAGKPTLAPITPGYDIFTTHSACAGERIYAPLPSGASWHGTPARGSTYADPGSYPASHDLRPACYGKWSYTGLTDKGHWIQEALSESSATAKHIKP